ncbi:MAG: Abi family protein [Leuconostoc mesenteroides]|uniref:Abi family protein n=1 Tax=Leuconostoc falkenbergense TaxID=2766470 RepID=UPI0004611F38|nr:Abi family protein [Leuconostoc falkenbergense]KDA48784.1 hypothetical protein L964_2003 [Leuconostoc pseudomesenteroides 1159]MCT4419597.1 Abi family protein [Leuconostoc falkenbergense]
MTKEEKPKLTSKKMIEKMESKNIRFEICSSKDAIAFLEKKNYYFKVNSYRRNFEEINGLYTNLDFAYLIDLAAIDAWLRRFLSPITLNVEHGFKVKLLNMIAANDVIDGYEIVEEFKNYDERTTSAYEQTVKYLEENLYSRGLYEKHKPDFAIWVLIESMTFGALSQFARFYDDKYSTRESSFHTLQLQMKSAKRIRNAVSHSNPILMNLNNEAGLFPVNQKTGRRQRSSASVVSSAAEMGIEKDLLRNVKINDLVALFYLNKRMTSRESRQHMVRDGEALVKRFDKHEDYYLKTDSIQEFKKILVKLIDFQLN